MITQNHILFYGFILFVRSSILKAVPKQLIDFIHSFDSFIIASHKEPDGDSIGSSLALQSLLHSLEKKTILLSAGPFKRTEIIKYEPLFVTRLDETVKIPQNTAVLVLDCSSVERVGEPAQELKNYPTAIIDHHATNENTNSLDYIDPTSPATTLLIQALIESIQTQITAEQAHFLLFGLCTDTGFFRHLDNSHASTFSYVARLIEAGANPKEIFSLINGGKSFNSRILISKILARMQSYYNGQLIISYETYEDTLEFGMEGRDSDTLYQLIQSIDGVEAMVIVRQESKTHCSVGFRSRNKVDVSTIASSFGGGGHKQASGLYTEGVIDVLIPQFVEAFKNQLS